MDGTPNFLQVHFSEASALFEKYIVCDDLVPERSGEQGNWKHAEAWEERADKQHETLAPHHTEKYHW